MLLRNATRVIESLVLDLYFDDGSEKHAKLDEKDIINITFNDNGYRKEIDGKITKIVSKPQPPAYRVDPSGCANRTHFDKEGYLLVDGHGHHAGHQHKINFSTILDCNIIEKYNEELFIRTVPHRKGAVTGIRIYHGQLQLTQDNGLSWINASKYIDHSDEPVDDEEDSVETLDDF